ncbi:hypothetical protein Ccr2_gp191c [Caulobacter phage Ccr2]|nr:hypothetical protein Ccr10_gp192c [Caulobacter phage Ccr10]ARB14067.1 hypothetical protein Ccr2_gp191c [Caulobacter phage Ccr2]
MDVGGSNGSHHSATLAKLVKRGLAEATQRSAAMSRGSKEYRVSEKGLEVYNAQRRQRWMTQAEWQQWFNERRAATRQDKSNG